MRWCLLLLVATAAFAQSGEKEPWVAPPEATAKANPLAGKPALAEGGKKMFTRTCAVCHDAGENQKGPSLSSTAVQAQTDGALFWKITNGNSRTGMPNFNSLPDGLRWQLVLYIRSMAKTTKP